MKARTSRKLAIISLTFFCLPVAAGAASIIYDFDSGDFPFAASSVDLPGVSADLSINNAGQRGNNYDYSFNAGNLLVSRLNGGGGNPVGSIGSNGLNGATGQAIGGGFAALFTIQITAGTEDLKLNSISWFNDNAASNRLARVAAFDTGGDQIGMTLDTPAALGTAAVLTIDGAAHTGGPFDGTIAAGSTATFWLDGGWNYNGGNPGIHAIDQVALDITVVPEPSALLLLGFGMLPVFRRRR